MRLNQSVDTSSESVKWLAESLDDTRVAATLRVLLAERDTARSELHDVLAENDALRFFVRDMNAEIEALRAQLANARSSRDDADTHR